MTIKNLTQFINTERELTDLREEYDEIGKKIKILDKQIREYQVRYMFPRIEHNIVFGRKDLYDKYMRGKTIDDLADYHKDMTVGDIVRSINLYHIKDRDDEYADWNLFYKTPFEKYVTRLDQLELSVRTYNFLKLINVKYLSDITHLSRQDFLKIKGCGLKTLKEIEWIVANYNCSLRE